MSYRDSINPNSKFYNTLAPTVISDEISVAATNTTTEVVTIPIGGYVTKVQLLAVNTVANVDLDLGDGADDDRYMDSLTTITQYNIVQAPAVASGDVAEGNAEVAGRFYATADTIDLIERTTGSANTATGTVQVLVWYHF